MEFKPYCAQCGAVKPDSVEAFSCLPCAKKGHSYPLVHNDKVRLERIERLVKFYDMYEYTEAQRQAIPSYRNLLTVPKEALEEVQQ